MNYKQTDPFYQTEAWKRARRERLRMDHGMCVKCMEEFYRGERMRPLPATMVHHVLPIKERPDLALDLSNMQSLCEMHNNREHPEKGGRGKARAAKRPPAGLRVIKV